jgi:hypothetical protein
MRARWRGRCNSRPAMTRFDRTWEPLAVVLAFAILWIGTL